MPVGHLYFLVTLCTGLGVRVGWVRDSWCSTLCVYVFLCCFTGFNHVELICLYVYVFDDQFTPCLSENKESTIRHSHVHHLLYDSLAGTV